jgi:hypothetical protein
VFEEAFNRSALSRFINSPAGRIFRFTFATSALCSVVRYPAQRSALSTRLANAQMDEKKGYLQRRPLLMTI